MLTIKRSGASASLEIYVGRAKATKNLSVSCVIGHPMTISKKGSRLIVVNGDRYRWRIRKKPTYFQGNVWTTLTVAVQKAENPSATLIIKMPQAHPCNWMGQKPIPVLPSDVEHCIKRASELGWKSSKPCITFEILY